MEGFVATFGIFGVIFGFVWTILLFLLPFFVYGAWQRAKEISIKMDRVLVVLEKQSPISNVPANSDFSKKELEAMGVYPEKRDQ